MEATQISGGTGDGALDGQISQLTDLAESLAAHGPRRLARLDDGAAAHCAQDIEHLSRLIDGLKVGVAGDLAVRVRAGRYDATGAATESDYLRQCLRISTAEAVRRTSLAEEVLPVMDSITGQVSPPHQPRLAGALVRGELSVEAARVVSSHVRHASLLCAGDRISPETVAAVEQELVLRGAGTDPDFLSRCGDRIVNHLDPNGKEPTEGELLAKEGIRFGRPRRGLVVFNGHMKVLDYEELITAIGTSTNPRTAANRAAAQTTAGGKGPGSAVIGGSKGPGSTVIGGSKGPGSAVTGCRGATGTADTDCTDSGGEAENDSTDTSTAHAGGTDGRLTAGEDSSTAGVCPAVPGAQSANVVDDEWAQSLQKTWTLDRGWGTETSGEATGSGSGNPDLVPRPEPEQAAESDTQPERVAESDMDAAEDDQTGLPMLPDDGTTDPVGACQDPDGARQDPVVKDQRTRAQQLLHGMIDCARMALRTGQLPDNGGLAPQLLVTVTVDELRSGLGSALLPYSGPVPVKSIRKTACDAGIIPVLMGSRGEILDVGRSQRTVSRAIRRALHARDKGCAFPDCTRPAYWTEAHHIVHWIRGGETLVDNCVLLCAYHHDLVHRSDWEISMIGGIPWFIPPAKLDYRQTPRRNHYHDPPPR